MARLLSRGSLTVVAATDNLADDMEGRMNRFGQEVIVSIETEGGDTLLDTTGLRVDFDVRLVEGYNRASVSIYNLNDETIASMIGGNKNNYCSLTTRLHGSQEFKLMDGYYVSNVVDEKKVPNHITTLYCFDRLRRQVLEKQVGVTVVNPTLEKQVQALMRETDFKGKVTYLNFPEGHIKRSPPRPTAQMSGTVGDNLTELGQEYNFSYYTLKDEFVVVFKPTAPQVPLTSIDGMPVLKLQTNNMRANPKLGLASIRISSNLDGNIRSGGIVDTSDLLTAGVDFDGVLTEEVAQVVDGAINNHVVGYSKFQIFNVQHVGSNWTNEWHTNAYGLSPAQSEVMPSTTWWK